VLDFLFERLPYQHDLSSPQGKTAAVEELVPALRDLADPIERAHYVQRLAAVVGVPETAIAELTRPAASRRVVVEPPTLEQRPDLQEEYVLALVSAGVPTGGLADDDFQRPDCRALWRWVRTGAAGEPPTGLAATWASVQALATRNADEPPDRLRAELDSTALELRKRRLARESSQIDTLLRDSEGAPARELAERLVGLAAQRAELERAQKAHGRVMAIPPRLQVTKERPRE
jgi:DNA primase